MANNFTIPFDESDIVFIVENKKIYAIKGCLCLCSPVFKAMFQGQFKETHIQEIGLPDKKNIHFLAFIKAIHLPCEDIKLENAKEIIQLAEEYQINVMKKKAELILLKKAEILDYPFAMMYNLELLKREILNRCENKSISEINKMIPLASFIGQGDTNLAEMIINRCIKYENDKEVENDELRSPRSQNERNYSHRMLSTYGQYTIIT